MVKRWLALDAMITTLTCSSGNLIPIVEEASILHSWGQKYAETLTPIFTVPINSSPCKIGKTNSRKKSCRASKYS